jgi:hypothetical protein
MMCITHDHVQVCVCVCVRACVRACARVRVCACAHTCGHMCVSVHTYDELLEAQLTVKEYVDFCNVCLNAC